MNDAQREILTDLIVRADMAFRKDSGKSWSEAMAEYLINHGTAVFPLKIGDTVRCCGHEYVVFRIDTYRVPYAALGGFGNNEIHYYAECSSGDEDDIEFYGGDIGKRVYIVSKKV